MKKKFFIASISIASILISFLVSFLIKNKVNSLPNKENIYDVFDEKGDGLLSEEIYPIPKKLIFSSPSKMSNSASNGITIQALTEPVVSDHLKLEWSAYFLKKDSSYALENRIEDFIRIEPNKNQCKIVCLAPFGESIIIRCKAVYQPTIFAECQIDYEKRIVDRKLEFSEGNFLKDDNLYYIDFSDESIYQFSSDNEFNTIYGIGSIEGSRTNRYYYSISRELEEYLLTETEIYWKTINACRVEILEWNLNQNELFKNINALPEDIDLFEELMYEAIPNFISSYPDQPLFYLDLESTGLSITQTFTYQIGAVSWEYSPKISKIKLDYESFIF